MDYIIHTRFKGNALCGEVNLPALTPCEKINGCIFCNGKPICYSESHIAHQHFARNNDGNGLLRGKLTQAIQKTLSTRDKRYQKRWDKVWKDPICQLYKRKEHVGHWLWAHEFYNADITTLEHIAKIIGVRKGDIQCI